MIGKEVESINFELMSPDVLRKMSAIRIITPDTYDDDGYPIESGLMDLRLGVIDPGLKCKTCGHRMISCPGHFGHIELVRPVLHIGYIKMIYMLLKSTCKKCGRILLSPDKVEEYKGMLMDEDDENEDEIMESIKKLKKVSKCPHCDAKQEKIKLLKPTTFFEDNQRILPSTIRERLERVTDSDLRMFGINPKVARPEWSILTALSVPPASLRPSITLETGERSEDDLTHKLVDILRINQRLADNISAGAPQLIIEDLWDLLQYHVTTYFNNDLSGIPPARHRSGRPLKTLFQRLKGKEGRFRYNLSGKRVDFSARTVLSPDPNIDIHEVGVPQKIAEELTIPVNVNESNLKDVRKYLRNEEYPKVNYIIRPDGRRKKVTPLNRDELVDEVEPGYLIERQLIEGDISMFNRQPSLHKHSMISHRIKILPGKTFRINDAVSTPYNADYDGDEMNLHIPQTEEARIECDSMMKINQQILSVRHGKPMVSPVLDHISGTYMITRKQTKFDKETALWILAQAGIEEPDEIKEEYTGKELFSMVLPKTLSLTYVSKKRATEKTRELKEKDPAEAFIKIKKGKLVSGAVDGQGLKGILIKKIYMEHGPEAAEEFIDKVTRLALAGVMMTGLTVGISDNDVPKEEKAKMKKILKKAEDDVDDLLEKYKKGKFERAPGKTKKETLEDLIMVILSQARNECGDVAINYLGMKSHAVILAKVGAKGSLMNLTQMSGTVGQTALRGTRILRGYRKKSLPHYKEHDDSAKARGFIESSFLEGLNPTEYFFHTMSGRDSLVDKGIRTGISGYMQRRLINAFIDISLKQDKSVRSANNEIIQFLYGEDGADPTFCYGDAPVNLNKYPEIR